MQFKLLPTLDTMLKLYQKPHDFDRFKDYLRLLQGDTHHDVELPISGFNPMAKEHIIPKIQELQTLKAEEFAQNLFFDLNKKLQNVENELVFSVALNISDDLKGGWTNRFTSDFDSKFKLNAWVKRAFCTPIFWTSEAFSKEMIAERILSYCYRTLYRVLNPNFKPLTLAQHLAQEIFISQNVKTHAKPLVNFAEIEDFYQKYQQSEDFHLIFNFFYGDAASEELGFKTFGIHEPFTGFHFATELAKKY